MELVSFLFVCYCGLLLRFWLYVTLGTHYTLTREHHFYACTRCIAGRLLAALTPRHTH